MDSQDEIARHHANEQARMFVKSQFPHFGGVQYWSTIIGGGTVTTEVFQSELAHRFYVESRKKYRVEELIAGRL